MEGIGAPLGTARRSVSSLGPFLKWAGGKSALLPQLTPLIPRRFGSYFEPFLGGASMVLSLRPAQATLSDLNPRLIDCYRAVRDEVERVIRLLEVLRSAHGPEQYYAVRQRLNQDPALTEAERAAFQIYLNKTCYNGLYRENKHGHFNVPIGNYTHPSIFCPDNLRAVSAYLKHATLICGSYETVLEQARPKDFIYLDPPYQPLSRTSSFTAYTSEGFDAFDQAHLAEVFKALDRKGCFVMQSNSSTATVRQLYKGYALNQVMARRSINSNGRSRGPIGELVIRNYTLATEARDGLPLTDPSRDYPDRMATTRG